MRKDHENVRRAADQGHFKGAMRSVTHNELNDCMSVQLASEARPAPQTYHTEVSLARMR